MYMPTLYYCKSIFILYSHFYYSHKQAFQKLMNNTEPSEERKFSSWFQTFWFICNREMDGLFSRDHKIEFIVFLFVESGQKLFFIFS